jgi:hypothetical protein
MKIIIIFREAKTSTEDKNIINAWYRSPGWRRDYYLDKNEIEKATSSEYLAKIDRVTNKIIAVITIIFALFICLKLWQNK